jgi:hypothetical protein
MPAAELVVRGVFGKNTESQGDGWDELVEVGVPHASNKCRLSFGDQWASGSEVLWGALRWGTESRGDGWDELVEVGVPHASNKCQFTSGDLWAGGPVSLRAFQGQDTESQGDGWDELVEVGVPHASNKCQLNFGDQWASGPVGSAASPTATRRPRSSLSAAAYVSSWPVEGSRNKGQLAGSPVWGSPRSMSRIAAPAERASGSRSMG